MGNRLWECRLLWEFRLMKNRLWECSFVVVVVFVFNHVCSQQGDVKNWECRCMEETLEEQVYRGQTLEVQA